MKKTIISVILVLCIGLSAAAADTPEITDDLGDFSFFKSDYITHRYTAYPNLAATLKGNEIVYEKFDYKNPDKGDRIILRKTVTEATPNDLHIDLSPKIFTTYRSSKVYKNFKLSGEFLCDFTGDDSSCFIYHLRDNVSTDEVINVYPMRINSDGSLRILDGRDLAGVAAKGKWFSVEMYINLDTRSITLFVDGDKVIDNKQLLPQDMKVLTMTRVQVRTGSFTGELQCRKMEFTGLDKPYDGQEIRTSMFGDDSRIRDYLADKTCFHYYGKSIYTKGTKIPMTSAPMYINDEMYISPADFNSAYGTAFDESDFTDTVKGSDGNILVPVKASAKKLMGMYSFDDTNGMIITAGYELPFDASAEIPYHKRETHTGYIDRLSTVQYIYDYLLFDRPSREILLEKFNSATDGGTQHPRIMATADDFERIRQQVQTDEYLKQITDNIISQADSYIKASAITYKYDDDLRTLSTANQLRDSMFSVGFAYQLTKDTKYSDWAWENLSALDSFPDINPGHPIDTGSYGAGIAIGYDWCYEAFTQEQRQAIEANAKRLHLTVIHDGFYGRSPVRGGPDGNINVVGYYNKWISNYNIWTNSGSLMMSLAFMDTYPELCSDLLWHSIRSLEYTFKNLFPDGAWVESTNYWDAVSQGMTYVFGSLHTVYGTDFNLSRFPGTEITGITNMALRSMVGSYNYHDAGMSGEYTKFQMSFLGKYFNRPALSAARKATLTKAFDSRMPNVNAHAADALYYNPDVSTDAISGLPEVHTARGLELFAVHEDYTDYDGLFFASQGGPVTFYHSHNDNGDFVFDLNGIRWADSLPAENYNLKLGQSNLYRARTEGHNTVTINNDEKLNQKANTYTPIIASGSDDTTAFAVYDMTDQYDDADNFQRGFYIDRANRTVTVRDEISLNKENSEVYWFMHTKANVEIIDQKTARLTRSGKTLILQLDTNADSAELSVMDAVPLPSSPAGEGQNTNSGYRKVAVRLEGSGNIDLTVRMAEQPGDIITVPIAKWQEGMSENFSFEVTSEAVNMSVYADESCKNPIAAVAYYTGDVLVGVDIYRDFTDYCLEASSDVRPGADRAKIMLWDSMLPLCNSKEIFVK